jgi:hypothetical protein
MAMRVLYNMCWQQKRMLRIGGAPPWVTWIPVFGCFLPANHSQAPSRAIGATLSAAFFAGGPQHAAVLNGHLKNYFDGQKTAKITTPYQIRSALLPRLPEFGLEYPASGTPEHPHPFHTRWKSAACVCYTAF